MGKKIFENQNSQLSHRVNSSPGEYFVTISTKNKECIFGEIVSDDVKLSPIGRIAEQCWKEITDHFTNVELDAFIVMPNHLHGIIAINPSVGIHNYESLQKHAFQHTIRRSLGSIISAYKGAVKRHMTSIG
ncbi:MAG: transposase [Bacteroidota bacterium]|jgi:REP element-mobilizing transposase RayT